MASCDCSMRAPPCLSSWSRLAERCARGHGTMMEDCTPGGMSEAGGHMSCHETWASLSIYKVQPNYIPKNYPNSTVKPIVYSCFMFYTRYGSIQVPKSWLHLLVSHEAFLAMTQIQSLGIPWLIMIVILAVAAEDCLATSKADEVSKHIARWTRYWPQTTSQNGALWGQFSHN